MPSSSSSSLYSKKDLLSKVFKKVKLICREVNKDDHNFHMMKNGIEKHLAFFLRFALDRFLSVYSVKSRVLKRAHECFKSIAINEPL